MTQADTTSKIRLKKAPQSPFKISVFGYLQLLLSDSFFTSQMVLSSLLLQVFMLAMPVFYMTIFNHVFGHQNLNTLNVMAIGMVMVLLLETLCKHGRGFVMASQQEWLDKISLQSVLQSLVKLPALEQVKQVNQANFSNLLAELTRNNQVMATSLLMAFMDGIFGFLLLGFLLILHPVLAAISISSLVPMALIAIFVTPKLQKSQAQQQLAQQRLQLKLNETLQQAEGLKLANASTNAATTVTEQGFKSFEKQISSRFFKVQGIPLQGLFINAASVLTLYFGAHEVLEGRMSYGVYMAINMLSRTVLTTMQQLLQSLMQFKQASESVSEMGKQLTNVEEKLQAQNNHARSYFNPTDIHGHLGLQSLTYAYPDQNIKVFDNAQLIIKAGEKVVITGPNGSGKTTLLRLLSGIIHPLNGQATVDGMPIEEIAPDKLSEFVGGIFHRPAVVANTIKHNLLLSNPEATMQQVSQAISFVGLDAMISKMQNGLETELAPYGANLSTGVLARLGLARLLIHNPQILLIDEVINSIDPPSARQIIQSLINIYPEKTMVIVSPDPMIHQMVDKVYLIQNNQIQLHNQKQTSTSHPVTHQVSR